MAYGTGWPIPHIRDELDLPMLNALREQWAQFPPLPVIVAHYLGAAKPRTAAKSVERLDAQPYIPTQGLQSEAFDALLASMSLPVTNPPPQPTTPP